MPRKPKPRETLAQKEAAGRVEMQAALREAIGALTVDLAANGMADVLNSEGMRPVVGAWQRALVPQPATETLKPDTK